MISNKNQETGEDKQLRILLSGVGGVLLLILLMALVGYLARSGNLDFNKIFDRASMEHLSQSIQASLENQARLMGLPFENGSEAFWYIARAGGIVSYLLLWLATCWGILMSSKVFQRKGNAPLFFALHEYLPLLGITFAAIHAVALLGDAYIGFDIWQLLLPFTSSYERFWTGLGSLAFYLFLALVISFYIRKKIGQKRWRALHYLSYLAFLFALFHGLMAGSDSGTFTMRALYLLTGGISLFLVYYRLLSYSPRKRRNQVKRVKGKRTEKPHLVNIERN